MGHQGFDAAVQSVWPRSPCTCGKPRLREGDRGDPRKHDGDQAGPHQDGEQRTGVGHHARGTHARWFVALRLRVCLPPRGARERGSAGPRNASRQKAARSGGNWSPGLPRPGSVTLPAPRVAEGSLTGVTRSAKPPLPTPRRGGGRANRGCRRGTSAHTRPVHPRSSSNGARAR